MFGNFAARSDFPEQSSRRRLYIFCAVFLLSALFSLAYVYSRPAEYRAVSRIQITPAQIVGEGDEIKLPSVQDKPTSFLTEVQVLTSRPLLQQTLEYLKMDATIPDLGLDPVDTVQRMLRADPVEQTQIVELSAVGPQKDFVWRLVNAVAATYRDRMAESYAARTSSVYGNVKEETDALHRQVLAKRAAIDAFREAHNIVSLEREENSVLAEIQNLSRSYAASNEAMAKAQGRMQALRSAAAQGGGAIGGKDDPTIAAMEQRASELREQLTNLQRRYTPELLALDVDTKSLQERIDALERQLITQRAAAHKAAIAAAEQELETSRSAAGRMRRDLDENQGRAQAFAARLAEYKVMQEDLDHVQNMERAAADRLTKMQASERERAPQIELLELAAPSVGVWRPNYVQDTIIALTGSFALGMFAVWFNGFIAGPVTTRAVLMHQTAQPRGLGLPSMAIPQLDHMPMPLPRVMTDPRLLQLSARAPLPRELESDEVAALVSNGSGDGRLAAMALLSGLTPEETVALTWNDIDFTAGTIAIGGETPRTLALEKPFAAVLEEGRKSTNAAAPVLREGRGGSSSKEELDRLILCAAYDANLDRPEDVTPASLRHTYLTYLLRCGIRAADIGRVAGYVPHDDLVGYMQLAAAKSRLPLEQIDLVHPALRVIAP